MIKKIRDYCTAHKLLQPNQRIIIGLSGGPDSVFLLHFLHQVASDYNLTLIPAHLDHEWRSNSQEDVKFCQNLAERLGLRLLTRKSSEIQISKKFNGSQEEIGRLKRRAFFEQLAQEEKANAIALGHHEQDQQETFFIRLIRGTTLSGLIGMRPKTGLYIRPLLETSKKEIINYLDEHAIPYLTDPTNASQSFLRNRIRSNVLPALQESDERFDQNFSRTLHSLQEAEQFLEQLTHKALHEISTLDGKTILVDARKLSLLPPYLYKRVLIHWLIRSGVPFVPSQGLLEEIKRFIGNEKSTEHMLYDRWMIKKHKGSLAISLLPTKECAES